jgi:hypothetical protein
MPCSLVDVYQRFGQICCLNIRVEEEGEEEEEKEEDEEEEEEEEGGGNRFLRSVEKYVAYYTASHIRKQCFQSLP